jgi:hypothetical protein
MAILATKLSPIVLLWIRKIDQGFTAVMTALLLLLDAVIVVTLMTQISGKIKFNPQERIRDFYWIRQRIRKRIRRRRRQMASEDPEPVGGDSTTSSSEDWHDMGDL